MKSPTGSALLADSVESFAGPETVILESHTGKVIALKGAEVESSRMLENHTDKVIALEGAEVESAPAPKVSPVKMIEQLKADPQNLGSPMQDQVALDLLHGDASRKVNITVSCELMHNSKIAMPRESSIRPAYKYAELFP